MRRWWYRWRWIFRYWRGLSCGRLPAADSGKWAHTSSGKERRPNPSERRISIQGLTYNHHNIDRAICRCHVSIQNGDVVHTSVIVSAVACVYSQPPDGRRLYPQAISSDDHGPTLLEPHQKQTWTPLSNEPMRFVNFFSRFVVVFFIVVYIDSNRTFYKGAAQKTNLDTSFEWTNAVF